MKKIPLLCSTASLIGLALSNPALAATYHVNSSEELRAALNSAQNNGESNVIHLESGEYSVAEAGPFVYRSPANHDLTLIGNTADPVKVILNGSHQDDVLVLINEKTGGNFVIKGLTVIGGERGLHTENAKTRIEYCAFEINPTESRVITAAFPQISSDELSILGAVFHLAKPPTVQPQDSATTQPTEQSDKWTLRGTTEAIRDMSQFDQVTAVWAYQEGQWKAYSAQTDIKIRLEAGGIEALTRIPAQSGFWVWRH
jgi:hypothetical protein